jgi:hypothetical protein
MPRDDAVRQRLLAISYVLPPVLAPQSIQIGRLLAHLDADIATVSGPLNAQGPALEGEGALARRTVLRIEAAFEPPSPGIALNLARRFVPFYARVPDEFRRWAPRAEAAVLPKMAETGFRPDVMASFGEPMSDHLVGLALKRRLGVPWLAHFSDPWVDNPFRAGQPLANEINRQLEAQVIEAADRVVFTSEETRALVMRKYPASWRTKTAVLAHAFDGSLYPVPSAKSGAIVIRHIGSFYGRRTPVPLLRGLRSIDAGALADVRVEFIGRVPLWLRVHPSWRALPTGMVQCSGMVSYARSLELMADSDLLLVIEAPDATSVFLPSKLIDYIGARIPIMGIVPPGASASLLRRMGGTVADPRQPREIAAALEQGLAEVRRRRSLPFAPWGDAAVRAEFEAQRIAGDFARLLAETARAAA